MESVDPLVNRFIHYWEGHMVPVRDNQCPKLRRTDLTSESTHPSLPLHSPRHSHDISQLSLFSRSNFHVSLAQKSLVQMSTEAQCRFLLEAHFSPVPAKVLWESIRSAQVQKGLCLSHCSDWKQASPEPLLGSPRTWGRVMQK